MNVAQDLVFGLLALQAGLIEFDQLIDACKLCTKHQHMTLTEILMNRGWIKQSDKDRVAALVEHELLTSGRDTDLGIAAPVDLLGAGGVVPRPTLRDPEVPCSQSDLTQPLLATPDSGTDFLPDIQERYTRIRLHATGGIGCIWLARDNYLGREIALKELRPDQAGNPMLRSRFLKEAQITGQLEHPGIVPVYDLTLRTEDQHPFYTMRFIKGRTLSEAARAFHAKRKAGQFDSLEWSNLLSTLVTVCNTVAYAHSRGVLHRDLKGQNVVLGDFGEVEVLEWGLAKVVSQFEGDLPGPSIHLDSAESIDPGLTVQGQVIGTPGYMAPEQAAGFLGQIDQRTDVYGLGAILY
jgi:tRNA A-37 threonylcarbamoyl transferase component Bud32